MKKNQETKREDELRELEERNGTPFSSLDPLEVGKMFGFTKSIVITESCHEEEELLLASPEACDFVSSEIDAAFECFRDDFEKSKESSISATTAGSTTSELSIPAASISLFIWSLLKEVVKRNARRKVKRLSSMYIVMKDDMFSTIQHELKKLKGERRLQQDFRFEEFDFDVIAVFLQNRRLIQTSKNEIRITREIRKPLHDNWGWINW